MKFIMVPILFLLHSNLFADVSVRNTEKNGLQIFYAVQSELIFEPINPDSDYPNCQALSEALAEEKENLEFCERTNNWDRFMCQTALQNIYRLDYGVSEPRDGGIDSSSLYSYDLAMENPLSLTNEQKNEIRKNSSTSPIFAESSLAPKQSLAEQASIISEAGSDSEYLRQAAFYFKPDGLIQDNARNGLLLGGNYLNCDLKNDRVKLQSAPQWEISYQRDIPNEAKENLWKVYKDVTTIEFHDSWDLHEKSLVIGYYLGKNWSNDQVVTALDFFRIAWDQESFRVREFADAQALSEKFTVDEQEIVSENAEISISQ